MRQRSEQFLMETFGPRFLPGGRSFHSSHLMERIGLTDAVNRGDKTKSGKDFVHTGCGSKCSSRWDSNGEKLSSLFHRLTQCFQFFLKGAMLLSSSPVLPSPPWMSPVLKMTGPGHPLPLKRFRIKYFTVMLLHFVSRELCLGFKLTLTKHITKSLFSLFQVGFCCKATHSLPTH